MNKGKILSLTLIFVLLMTSISFAAPVHKDIFSEVSQDNIFNHIVQLTNNDNDNARVTGFEGEHGAANYIATELSKYGLEVESQQFPVLAYLNYGTDLLVNGETIESKAFTFTPSTPEEGITAELVYVGLGSKEDFEGKDVEGKIALIKRGSFSFYDKTQNAADAGAVGAIIFNNSTGMINGTLGSPTNIPVIAVSDVDGNNLVSLLEEGPVIATMIADTEVKDSFSQNIIAKLPASRGNKSEGTIIIGAHYDGVDTPAANDNASGTATMLEIARVLSSKQLAYDIKFMAFGAEEIGLVGAQEYVKSLNEEELNDIVAMINMDMVGVGNRMGVMTLGQNDQSFVADLAENYIQEFGHAYNRGTSGSSDHAPFAAAGIPVVFLNYGPDPNYHTDEDSLDKIDKNNLYNMATLVTAMAYDMAKNPMPEAYNGLTAKLNKYNFVNQEIPME